MLSPRPSVSGADARPPVVKDASPRYLHAPYLLFRVYSVAALTPHSVAAATFPRHSYPWILLRSRNYDKLQVHSKSEAVARPLRDGLTR